MDYEQAVKLKDVLKPELFAAHKNYAWLPDEIIVHGSADGYRLSIITRKGSGVTTVDQLPDEMLMAALDALPVLKIEQELSDVVDVKESRVAVKPAGLAMKQ